MRLWALLLTLGCTLGVACATTSTGSSYSGGLSSCREFARAVNESAQGVLTDEEFRAKLQTVQRRGSTAEPDIKAASTRMLSAITQRDSDGYETAAGDMLTACRKHGYLR